MPDGENVPYLVTNEHLDVLISSGLQAYTYERLRWFALPRRKIQDMEDYEGAKRELSPAAADRTGAMLWAENQASINYRCGSTDLEPLYAYTIRSLLPPVEVLKAIDCYEYQASETQTWPESEAASFCQVLRSAVTQLLPGYDNAEWAIGNSQHGSNQPLDPAWNEPNEGSG